MAADKDEAAHALALSPGPPLGEADVAMHALHDGGGRLVVELQHTLCPKYVLGTARDEGLQPGFQPLTLKRARLSEADASMRKEGMGVMMYDRWDLERGRGGRTKNVGHLVTDRSWEARS